MLAILISIRSRHIANIFNGKKLRELRKKFPKHYRGWVYIYCCKDKLSLAKYLYKDGWGYDAVLNYDYAKSIGCAKEKLNGKVVARFWVDDVTEYINGGRWNDDNTFGSYDDYIKDNVCEEACVTEEELFAYSDDLAFFSIHISKLEIFEEPKELNEFWYCTEKHCIFSECHKYMHCRKYLKRPPQSWQYVEVTL